jgi:2-oxoglutarate dehydrogenase E1 component
MGENLAYATLLAEGYGVRVSGEDCGRGTFFHRHAVLHDQKREKWDSGNYMPLQHLQDNQAPCVVIDSVLSEEAVLAFEYGYATTEPNDAGGVGSAVRRFRQRRPGRDRPVHRVW